MSGRRRAEARAFAAALFILALACDSPEGERVAERAPAPQPESGSACELGEPMILPGVPIALASDALLVRDDAGLRLLRLDAPGQPVAVEAELVPRRGLVARGSSVLALARTAAGPAVLVIDGGAVRTVPLGDGGLTDGALAARGDSATAAWVDGGALLVSRIDLLRSRASEPERLEVIGESTPLVAATRAGAVVSWTARGASLVTVREGASTRLDAPGLPLDLLGGPDGASVLHQAADRTGAWLSSAGAPSVRVTHPEARAASASIAALPDGSVLVYREDADVFLQRLSADAIPRGGPRVVGGSGPQAPRTAPLVASEGSRVWVAWQSAGETGVEARVRPARCP